MAYANSDGTDQTACQSMENIELTWRRNSDYFTWHDIYILLSKMMCSCTFMFDSVPQIVVYVIMVFFTFYCSFVPNIK